MLDQGWALGWCSVARHLLTCWSADSGEEHSDNKIHYHSECLGQQVIFFFGGLLQWNRVFRADVGFSWNQSTHTLFTVFGLLQILSYSTVFVLPLTKKIQKKFTFCNLGDFFLRFTEYAFFQANLHLPLVSGKWCGMGTIFPPWGSESHWQMLPPNLILAFCMYFY